MKRTLSTLACLALTAMVATKSRAQINVLQDYKNYTSAAIGTYQGINFREAGFSALYPIPNTNGKEFWTCSDRGVNIDGANANPGACHPTYDKIFPFPNYAPKIHRIRVNGDSIQILQTITMKRPSGTNAVGVLNPTGFGSTAAELVSTDTVLNCANFNTKTAAKDIWGIDAEGIVVDKSGNFWICEEGGATIWKLDQNGKVTQRYTPYANLVGAQPQDVPIDTVFKFRKNNRGFEGIAIAPNGKIYAMIQSPILFPTTSVGENSRIHRLLEIDPATNAMRMFAYLNDGIIGAAGPNQIRLKDWKLGDLTAINNDEFIVLEAAARGTTDIKKMYKINISGATPVTSGLYSGLTLEALVDATGLANNGITPVTKTLVMDLLANGWPATLDKAEGVAIINDSTIAICNDNDYGQSSPAQDGIATATGNLSHLITYSLQGANKLNNFQFIGTTLSQGQAGPSTAQTPYLTPAVPGVKFTSIISAGEVANGYKMVGLPDGLGAFDNGNGTFTVLMNHEAGNTSGINRAHGSKGAFVSKWVINKSDLSIVSGSDLMQTVKLWNTATQTYTTYNTASPMPSGFSRFCSADLPAPSAFYNSATGKGTQERIFMNGEENGNEGRGMGHIVTGPNAGTSYELPALGKFSWENALANPATGDKTVVAGTDDATPGQVYFYIGDKTNAGTEIEKAGLSNGNLYGPVVQGMFTETSAVVPAPGTPFTMANLGSVKNITGATIEANSNTAGITRFLRPEDGAWDPSNPNDFYFNTTNAFGSPSRVWKMHFTNINDLTQGGTITAVLDGTEGQQMLDNMTIDNSGHIMLVEDVGNNAHNGKVWQYTIATDELKQVGRHDSTRFQSGGANFLTTDEEASGIIDVQQILGPGMFLTVDQAHYSIPGEVIEGGQLLAFFNPDTYNNNPEIDLQGNNISIADGDITPSVADNTDYGNVNPGDAVTKSFVIKNEGPGSLVVSNINLTGAAEFTIVGAPVMPLTISANSTQTINVKFAPVAITSYNTTLNLVSNDFSEGTYDITIKGNGLDMIAPVPDLATLPTITGECSATATAPTATDSYAGAITGTTSDPLTYNAQGTYTIHWTYNDGNGNTSTQDQAVVIQDMTNPLISGMPANITVSNAAGLCSAVVSWNAPSATDNCGFVTLTSTHQSGNSFPMGTTTVTYTATDATNHQVQASFTVTVNDTQNPVVSCPASVTVNCQDPTTVAARGTATATDNCGVQSVTNSDVSTQVMNVNTPGYYNYVITRTWTATDIHNNTGNCVQTITVHDVTAPSATAPASITACDNQAGNSKTLSISPADACSPVTTTYTITGATTATGSGTSVTKNFNVGTSTVTWTIKDVSNNSATVSTTVTIRELPVATITPSSPDFCNVLSLTANSSHAGTTTYAWTLNNANFASTKVVELDNSNADGTYKVTVTDQYGCTSNPASYNYQKQNMLSNYTILGYKKVDLGKDNDVINGSVGARDINGEVRIGEQSSVPSPAFVKADHIVINFPATVPNRYYSPAVVTLPSMLFNTTNPNNLSNYTMTSNGTLNGNYKDLTIKQNVTATITGTIFRKVKIEKNAKVTFTSADINMQSLDMDQDVILKFNRDANLRMTEKVTIDKECVVNAEGKKVTFYMGDASPDNEKFTVRKNNNITANVYMPNGKLKVDRGDHWNHNWCCYHNNCHNNNVGTFMIGTFIAERIESGEDVTWDKYDCDALADKPGSQQEEQQPISAITEPSVENVKVYPNPNNGNFTVALPVMETKAELVIMDLTGKVIVTRSIGRDDARMVQFNLENLANGLYLLKVLNEGNVFQYKITKH